MITFANVTHGAGFNCLHSAHDPVRCEMLDIWMKKCEDDSETSNWIAVSLRWTQCIHLRNNKLDYVY